MLDMVIIGSGPAGLAAAIYAQRALLDAVVIEKEAMSGGQIINTYEVDNYPGFQGINGFDLAQKFREHAEALGARFENASAERIEEAEDGTYVVKTGKGDFAARTVVIAAGATHAKLGIPGEDRLGGRGVSYCATCDGAFFRKKVAVVIGGGDVAAEDALFLARGCSKVYLVHRRDQLRAAATLAEKVKENEKIEVLWNSVPLEIQGENRVESIRLMNKVTGEEYTVETSAVFVAVGIIPQTDAFRGFVDMDERGYIEASEEGITSRKGVYAAGDARKKALRQIITAAADGANAAEAAVRYIRG
ncbi:MAG: thioredoxin-disulfide reductase [Lachnospiraceae bacterium]|nr:thioredoxin-disulfide reductase [Lachnospiraceae bacterium]